MPRSIIFILASVMTNLGAASTENHFDFNSGILALDAVDVPGSGVYQAELYQIDNADYHFQLDQLLLLNANNTISGQYLSAQQTVYLPIVKTLQPNANNLDYRVEMQLIPGSQPLRFLLMNAYGMDGQLAYSKALNTQNGVLRMTSREQFSAMASHDNSTGNTGIEEIKFLITDINSNYPIAYFQNSVNFPLHADFAIDVLGQYQSAERNFSIANFNADTYFSERRQNLAGSIVYHVAYQSEGSSDSGLYTIEFWPTDPVPFDLIEKSYQIISAALPISHGQLSYHPVSTTQETLYLATKQQFEDAKIPVLLNEQLFAQSNLAILNKGEAYGRLRIMQPNDPLPSAKDIVIYTFIPNSLSHVAGIITDTPQTPLSHINLKARQNNTPNAYLNAAATSPEIAPLIDQWVHFQVSDNGITIEETTQQIAELWLENIRPAEEQIPESNLNVNQSMPLSILGFDDWTAFGVKAANVAELAKILPSGVAPDGYAIPFSLYDQYMGLPRCGTEQLQLCVNGEAGLSFYQQALQMISMSDFQTDAALRSEMLNSFRDRIENGEVAEQMTELIETVRYFWEPDGPPFSQSLRTRSSTNNEDLPGFNGAGLYNSYTHKPKEGDLVNSVKQVWASLWSDRAYEERDFHRIDHFQTYMGVLIHPNYGDEQANGVAVSRNIYNPNWEGYYINAQYGEISITNPEPIETSSGLTQAVPDEIIISLIPASLNNLDWETQFIRHSNVETVYDLPVPTINVLTDLELNELRDSLQTIQNHFKNLYQGGPGFAMEIEFKITETNDGSRGQLAIKQARPWVE